MGIPPVLAPADLLTSPLQTGRALIGWMTANEAKLWLSGRRVDLQNQEEYERRAEQARAAVAARPPSSRFPRRQNCACIGVAGADTWLQQCGLALTTMEITLKGF